jgi:hypothetical protein
VITSEGEYYEIHPFDQALLASCAVGQGGDGRGARRATSPHDFELLVASNGQRSTLVDQVLSG